MIFSVLGVVALLSSAPGVPAAEWSMLLPAQVSGTKGQGVVLPCSFTHPQQDSFSGNITVIWIFGNFHGDTLFRCSVTNTTWGKAEGCMAPTPPGRYSLQEDPRFKNLSLLIRDLQLEDNGQYFCRVELNISGSSKFENTLGTQLLVTAPAQILSLSQISEPAASNGSLECVAEGNPLPHLTWLSASGPLLEQPTSEDKYRVRSRIPIGPEDSYTCRATNKHGETEKTIYLRPRWPALTAALAASASLTLLIFVSVLFWLKRKGTLDCCLTAHSSDKAANPLARCAPTLVLENPCGTLDHVHVEDLSRADLRRNRHATPDTPERVPVSEFPLYANIPEIAGMSPPLEAGKSSEDLMYTAVNVIAVGQGSKSPETDVCYAEVKFR